MGGDGDVGCLVNCNGEERGALWNGHLMVPLVHHLKHYHFRSRLENVKKLHELHSKHNDSRPFIVKLNGWKMKTAALQHLVQKNCAEILIIVISTMAHFKWNTATSSIRTVLK